MARRVKKKKGTRFPLWRGDVLDKLAKIEDNTYDGCLTDPPYGIGFMGKRWDHGVPSAEVWAEVLRVLKPGAGMLVFGGTRTHHRLIVNIEDAGFRILDVMSWMYGSGFPKSHNIENHIDKKKGHGNRKSAIASGNKTHPTTGEQRRPGDNLPKYEGRSEEGKTWQGYGTALKPAWEPIILAMKPCDGSYADNALTHGVAGLNIDGTRIDVSGGRPKISGDYKNTANNAYEGRMDNSLMGGSKNEGTTTEGRWPANVLLEHHPECEYVGSKRVKSGPAPQHASKKKGKSKFRPNQGTYQGQGQLHADEEGKETVEQWNCHPECPVRMLDEQTGELKSHGGGKATHGGMFGSGGEVTDKTAMDRFRGDSGGPSRFFYTAKANRRERTCDGTVENKHPTVKPLDICEYLAKLLLPPARENERRRILVPFCGSGSELCGAILAGWDAGLGIDSEQEYLDIARKRIEYVRKNGKP